VVLVAVDQLAPRDPVQLPEQIPTIRFSTTLRILALTQPDQPTVKGPQVVAVVLAVQQPRKTVEHL
jgi:hypothetical protein